MSQLYVSVILRNAREYVLARHGHMAPEQVHTYESPRALIDTGALHVVLPPYVAEQLGLLLLGSTGTTMADGRLVEGELSEPVLIESCGVRSHWRPSSWATRFSLGPWSWKG